jgi:short-subunit dehydrogenase
VTVRTNVPNGNIAVVTGAGSGMGQLAARRLAAAGVSVAAVDVDEPGLAETTARAPTMRSWTCDVTEADAVGRTVKEIEADLGPVDRLVHAAGICLPGRLADQSEDDIEHTMRVNYLGTVRVVKAVLPRMLERRRGDVITFASLAGWLPTPYLGAYAATKFAVVAFTEVLADEHEGSGLRFACVCPPVVETPMVRAIRATEARAIGSQRGIDPGVVIDAIERALERGDLFVFPGPAARRVWRLRRHAPGVVRRMVRRQIR